MRLVSCNLCGNDEAEPFVIKDGMSIVRCRRCGLIYNNPQKVPDELPSIYNEDYFKTTEYFTYGYEDYLANEQNLRRTFRKRIEYVQRFMQSGYILDVGCATGFFLDEARKAGWRIAGVEVSPYASVFAKEHLGLDVATGELEEVNWPEGTFDVVTLWGLAQELVDPVGTFRETYRILKPGGYCFVLTSNVSSLPARILGPRWIEFKPKTTTTYFSPLTLRMALEGTSFHVSKLTRRHCGQYVDWGFLRRRLVGAFSAHPEQDSAGPSGVSFYFNSGNFMLAVSQKPLQEE